MIMSRRKQTNPKPLKREEDDQWDDSVSKSTTVSQNELESENSPLSSVCHYHEDGEEALHQQNSLNQRPQQEQPLQTKIKVETVDERSPSPHLFNNGLNTDEDFEKAVSTDQEKRDDAQQAVRRKSRFKSQLDFDPANIFSLQKQKISTPIKLESKESTEVNVAQECSSSSSSLSNASSKSLSVSQVPEIQKNVPHTQQPPQAPYFTCSPCGIRFSSFSTLEAHQTYYCAFRKNQNPAESEESEEKPKDGPDADSKIAAPAINNLNKNVARIPKQYVCNHCSYSADKRASLNRHMRMHSLSPNSPATSIVNGTKTDIDSTILADRYCSNCDIKFSSVKTFRAHKLHYCSGRHNTNNNNNNNNSGVVIVNNNNNSNNLKDSNSTSESAPTSPVNEPFSPSSLNTALPNPTKTNQPINIQQSYLALPTNPILIIPYSLIQNASFISNSANFSNKDHPDSPSFLFPNGSIYPMTQAFSMALMSLESQRQQQQQQQQQQTQPINPTQPHQQIPPFLQSQHNHQQLKSKPLMSDTETKKRPVTDISSETPIDLSVKRLKSDTSFLGENSRTPTPEMLICTPSILVGDQTSSPTNLRNESISPSKTVSPKSMKDNVKSLNQASVALTIPTPFSVPLILNNAISNPSIITHEMAIKLMNEYHTQLPLNANSVPSVVPVPQVVVKQGISKCQECNIVFSKYETYLAHKKHYCSARIKVSSPPANESSKQNVSLSPAIVPSSVSTVNGTSSNQSPSSAAPVISFNSQACPDCGIKFTTIDNLTAHQTYYCLKRKESKAEVQSDVKSRCLKCKKMVDLGHKCNEKPQQQQQINQNSDGISSGLQNASSYAWNFRCPICEEICITASAANRHMEIHTNIKSYKCCICHYKGSTLRGLRTHIRMHLINKEQDEYEESYIACVFDDNSEIRIMNNPFKSALTSFSNMESTNTSTVIMSNDQHKLPKPINSVKQIKPNPNRNVASDSSSGAERRTQESRNQKCSSQTTKGDISEDVEIDVIGNGNEDGDSSNEANDNSKPFFTTIFEHRQIFCNDYTNNNDDNDDNDHDHENNNSPSPLAETISPNRIITEKTSASSIIAEKS